MSTRHHRLTDPLIALGVGLAAFALYLRTLAPGLLWGDSAEFQFAAWLGGFAHPTGYPLYLMLGWLWTHLLPLGDPAWRMNLFSALWGGVAVGLVYLVASRILRQADSVPRVVTDGNVMLSGLTTQITWRRVSSDREASLREASPQHGRDLSLDRRCKVFHVINPLRVTRAEVGAESRSTLLVDRLLAVVTALVFAATPTFWSQAVVAEVYTLHAVFVAAILLAALAWADHPRRLRLYLLVGLVGLGLAHHRTTLLLLPGLVVFLFIRNGGFSRSLAQRQKPAEASISDWLTAVALLLAPLLLYAYIPLVAPRTAYYTVALGAGQTLALYEPTLSGFLTHISGSVFGSALGVARGPWLAELAGRLAGELTWPGVALGLLGVAWLAWRDRRTLALTGLSFLAFVLFNAFYAIGDIFVFYIPAYLIWVLWMSVGVWAVGWVLLGGAKRPPICHAERVDSSSSVAAPDQRGISLPESPGSESAGQRLPRRAAGEAFPTGGARDSSPVSRRSAIWLADPLRVTNANILSGAVNALLIAGFLALAGWLLAANFARVDRSADRTARDVWDAVLAQAIPQDAILITNDRDEMAPQWYLRYVEGRRADLTGLFPLIQPGVEWSDVAAVTEQALRTSRPVYLIKPMPGLEVKFVLRPVSGAVAEGIGAMVRVDGPAAQGQLARTSGAVFGAQIRLAGYEARPETLSPGRTLEVALDWEPLASLAHDYTTFVHLVNAEGRVIGQSDHRPGGIYYPTSLWRAGERLRDVHRFVIANDPGPAPYTLEVGIYRLAPDLQHLGNPQRIGELESAT